MRQQILIFFLLPFSIFVSGQRENLSSLNVVNLNYQFHPKFFLYSEFQARGNEDFTYPDYYEIKGGLGYNLTENNKPLLGIGRYVNYTDHQLSKEEFRIWIQDVISLKAGIFKFENRVRVEQSWFYEPQKSVHSKRNRFRYRLNISAPLNSKKIEKGTLSANVYDEVFYSTPLKPNLSRNRIFAGLSYQLNKEVSVSSGYLWQREFGAVLNRNFHYLYFAFNINLDSSQNETERFHPHVPD